MMEGCVYCVFSIYMGGLSAFLYVNSRLTQKVFHSSCPRRKALTATVANGLIATVAKCVMAEGMFLARSRGIGT